MHHRGPGTFEGIPTKTYRFGAAAVLFVTGALLLSGTAFAVTTSETSASQEATFSQEIDIPRDNVLAALALGLHGNRALALVSNVDRVGTFERSFDRNIDLDDDDVLLLLALDRSGSSFRRAIIADALFDDDIFGHRTFGDPFFGHRGFGDPFRSGPFRNSVFDDDIFFDGSTSARAERALHRSVDLSDDDVLAALALGGNIDIWDIADIEFGSSSSFDFDSDFDLDDDDTLLWLALT